MRRIPRGRTRRSPRKETSLRRKKRSRHRSFGQACTPAGYRALGANIGARRASELEGKEGRTLSARNESRSPYVCSGGSNVSRRHTATSPFRPRTHFIATVLLICLVGAVGCNSSPPEEKLEEAAENLHQAQEVTEAQREEISHLNDELAAKHAEVRDAKEELEEARQRLDKAQRRLQRARERLDTRATDVALFRRIQRSLLDDDALKNTAISVRVDDRVVTLQGTLADPGQRDRAIEIASAAPGVAQVKDSLQVRAGDEPARREEKEQTAGTAQHERGTGGAAPSATPRVAEDP